MPETGHGEGQTALLREVAAMYAELGQELASVKSATPFDALTQVAIRRVSGARGASITTLVRGQFSTTSATDDRARELDAIQYELQSGPCVDAIVEDTLYHPRDLSRDTRWPEFAQRAITQCGVHSMMCYRLHMEHATDETIAGLNMYSDHPNAFDDEAVQVGLLLATYAAALVTAEINREKAHNLEYALQASRDIGVAMGVLMTRHELTRDEAFSLLRTTSQHTHRKVRDIAVEVADTGTLPLVARRRSASPANPATRDRQPTTRFD
jgi:hypothetical protein